MATQDNSKIVRDIFESFNRRDFDSMQKSVDKACEILVVPREQTFKGPDGVKQFLQNRINVAPDSKIEVKNIVSGEDSVTVEYIIKGKHDGTLHLPSGGDLGKTGKPVNLRFCDIITIRDQKITRWNTYYDLATLLNQVGALHEMVHH
ncbi:MAG: nuclear transport factor 2 family protein [Methanococcaceae archaeon]